MAQDGDIRILLVEDSPGDARLIREMLREHAGPGADLTWAEDLAHGLAALRENGADLAFLDLHLPDSSGLETVDAVLAQRPDLPVVVLTGSDDERNGLEAVRHGAQDYLVKGRVDGQLLMHAARYAIERQRLETDLAQALKRLDREIKVVASLQASLLPQGAPRVPGIHVCTDYRPAGQAAGDYFDFFPLEGGRLGVLLADVSGHGAHAAVLMAMTRALAHEMDCRQEPGGFLTRLNASLCRNVPPAHFVAALYGVLDPGQGVFDFAATAIPAPLLCGSAAESVEDLLFEPLLPLGVKPGVEYASCSVALDPGSVLLLYTDGVVESLDGTDAATALMGLKKAVAENRVHGVERVRDAIIERLHGSDSTAGPSDDATFIVLQCLP